MTGHLYGQGSRGACWRFSFCGNTSKLNRGVEEKDGKAKEKRLHERSQWSQWEQRRRDRTALAQVASRPICESREAPARQSLLCEPRRARKTAERRCKKSAIERAGSNQSNQTGFWDLSPNDSKRITEPDQQSRASVAAGVLKKRGRKSGIGSLAGSSGSHFVRASKRSNSLGWPRSFAAQIRLEKSRWFQPRPACTRTGTPAGYRQPILRLAKLRKADRVQGFYAGFNRTVGLKNTANAHHAVAHDALIGRLIYHGGWAWV